MALVGSFASFVKVAFSIKWQMGHSSSSCPFSSTFLRVISAAVCVCFYIYSFLGVITANDIHCSQTGFLSLLLLRLRQYFTLSICLAYIGLEGIKNVASSFHLVMFTTQTSKNSNSSTALIIIASRRVIFLASF